MTFQRKLVLFLPTDRLRERVDVLRCLAHGFVAVHILQSIVREAPSKRRIPHRLRAPGEAAFALGNGVGGARHALDTSCHEDLPLAGFDRAVSSIDRLQPGGAEPVEGHRSHLDGQAGQEGGHAGHIAVVFSRLIGAAEIHLFDLLRPDCSAFDRLPDDQRRHVVRAHGGQCAAVRADRGADGGYDHGIGHRRPPFDGSVVGEADSTIRRFA